MQLRLTSRPYEEAGLAHVRLENVETFVCPECGEEVLRLPRIEELHRVIAALFVTSLRRLFPSEFRFLRKYTGMSSGMLAGRLGVSDSLVCAWERGEKKTPFSAEWKLRLIVLREQPIKTYEALLPQRAKEPRLSYESGRRRWRRDGMATASPA